MDLARRGPGQAGLLLRLLGQPEDVDQVLRRPRGGELGDGARLGVEAGAEAVLDPHLHHLDGAQGGRVVAARRLQGLLARLVEEDLPPQRVLLQQQLLEVERLVVGAARLVEPLQREVAQGVEEARVGEQGVDQPQLQRLAADHRLAGEDEVERLGDADPPRQPRRAPPAGKDAEPHLGKPHLGVRPVARHPVGRGERDLQAAAEADAADGGDGGEGERLPGREQSVPDARARLRLDRIGDARDLLDVRAGDEAAGLAREQDQARRCPCGRRAPGAAPPAPGRRSRVKTLTFRSGESNVSVARRSAPTSRWKMDDTRYPLESPNLISGP